jgi:hypothetical protein
MLVPPPAPSESPANAMCVFAKITAPASAFELNTTEPPATTEAIAKEFTA